MRAVTSLHSSGLRAALTENLSAPRGSCVLSAGRNSSQFSSDPRFAMSRSSTATYINSVGKSTASAVNHFRFDEDFTWTNGGEGGWMSESASTNFATKSEEFDHANWVKTRSTVSADAVAAPADGDPVTADSIDEDGTASSTHFIYQNYTVANNTFYGFSVFAKKANRDWIALAINYPVAGIQYAYFDLNTGTLGTVLGADIQAHIRPMADGWYRCCISASSGSGDGSTPFEIYAGESNNDSTFSGLSQTSVYVWGAQIETLDVSSYIPTTTVSVTRAMDLVRFTLESPGLINACTISFAQHMFSFLGRSNIKAGAIVENPLGTYLNARSASAGTTDRMSSYTIDGAGGIDESLKSLVSTPAIGALLEWNIRHRSGDDYHNNTYKIEGVLHGSGAWVGAGSGIMALDSVSCRLDDGNYKTSRRFCWIEVFASA